MDSNIIPTLRVQTLGRFQAVRADQPIPDNGWGTHRAKTVLKLLLSHLGQTVPRDQILESVWHDARSQSAATRALYTAISDLRSLLEPSLARGADSHFILSTEDGYQFNSEIEQLTLDKVIFERDITAARVFVARREWQDAAKAYTQAETLYAGDYLPDDVYADWSGAERERLRALFLVMLLENAEVHARLGLYRDAIVRCRRALELDNCLEQAYRALMVYYDAGGARPQALRTYTECEIVLQRELGVKPTHETFALYASIKASGSRDERADAPLSNLPIASTSFIGRKRELAELQAQFAATRLLTLTGAGGSGKTRLGLEFASEQMDSYINGVWCVELAALRDPTLVVRAVAKALNVRDLPNQPLEVTLAHFLRNKPLLLVLDNCEHLVAACAQLAHDLLSQCRDLKFLATSREPLGVAGELTWEVPTLTLPSSDALSSGEPLMQYEAIRLFVERAVAVNRHFSLNPHNAPAVLEICQRLDGMPLAIELAAARSKLLSPEQIAARLDERFALLTAGGRTAPTRQQTLRATLDWSYDLLTATERDLFRQLSVFVGGFTLDALEQVAELDSNESVLGVLGRLVDKSLVVVEQQPTMRFRLLETIREYAWVKLSSEANESGASQRLRRRHRDFFIVFAEQAAPKLKRAEQFAWLARLEEEHENLRAAWDYAIETDDESARRLASAVLDFWVMRGNRSEGRDWLDLLLERASQWKQSVRHAQVLLMAGRLAHSQYDFGAARRLFEQALPIAQSAGDKRELAFALLWLGRTLGRERNDQSARQLLADCLMLYHELHDEWSIAWAMFDLGDVAFYQGHYAETKERDLAALTIFQDLGDRFSAAYVLNALGELARLEGNYEQAGKFYEENLKIHREFGHRVALAAPLFNLAWVTLHQGNYRQAQALFKESVKLFRQDANENAVVNCLAGFGSVMGLIGKPEAAARLFGAVEALLASWGNAGQMDPSDQREFDHYVAVVRSQLDEVTFAKAWAEGRTLTLEQAVEYAFETLQDSA